MSSGGNQYGGGARTTPAYPGYGSYGNSSPTYGNAANYAMNRLQMMPSYSSGGYGQYGSNSGGYGFSPPNGRFTTQEPPWVPQPDPNAMNKPAQEGGSAPYTGGAMAPAPNMTGRVDSMPIPQAPVASNYNNVASFQMPGQIQQPRMMTSALASAQQTQMTPQQWQAQNAQLLRPGTVQDPATVAGPAKPVMPPQPADNQYGQHGSYWGPDPMGSAYSGQPFGWHPQFNSGARQYMIGQLNGPNGAPSWMNQIDPNDYLGSIGRLSGTPYNPTIFGAP